MGRKPNNRAKQRRAKRSKQKINSNKNKKVNPFLYWLKTHKIIGGVITGIILYFAYGYLDDYKLQKNKFVLTLDEYKLEEDIYHIIIYFMPIGKIGLSETISHLPLKFLNNSSIPIENFEFQIIHNKPHFEINKEKLSNNIVETNYIYNPRTDRFFNNDECFWDYNEFKRMWFLGGDLYSEERVIYKSLNEINPKKNILFNEIFRIDTLYYEKYCPISPLKGFNYVKDYFDFRTLYNYKNNKRGNIQNNFRIYISNISNYSEFINLFFKTSTFGGAVLHDDKFLKNPEYRDVKIFLIFPKFINKSNEGEEIYQLSEEFDIYRVKFKHNKLMNKRTLIFYDKDDKVIRKLKFKEPLYDISYKITDSF